MLPQQSNFWNKNVPVIIFDEYIFWHRRHKSNILYNGHEFHYLNWKYSTFDCTTIIKIDWHSFLSILMSPVWYEHTCTFVIWNLNEINLLVFTSIIHAFQFANISTKNIYKHVCVTHYTIRPVQFQWRKIFFFSLACACGGIFHQKCKTHCWKKVKKKLHQNTRKTNFPWIIHTLQLAISGLHAIRRECACILSIYKLSCIVLCTQYKKNKTVPPILSAYSVVFSFSLFHRLLLFMNYRLHPHTYTSHWVRV